MADIIDEDNGGEMVICTVQNDHDYIQAESDDAETVELYYPNAVEGEDEVEEEGGEALVEEHATLIEEEEDEEGASILQVVGKSEMGDRVRLVLHNVKDGSEILLDQAQQLGNVCLIIKDECSDGEEEEEEEQEDPDDDDAIIMSEALEQELAHAQKVGSEHEAMLKCPNLTLNDCWWAETCGPPYICKLCEADFRERYTEFRQHVEDHCDPLFEYAFFDKSVSDEESEYNFEHLCTTCGRCFNNNIDLTSHRSTHRKRQIYSCDACQKSFFSPSAYKAHMLKEHLLDIGEEDDDAPVMTLSQKRGEKSFRDKLHKCNLCDEEFEISTMLDMHKKQVHEVTTYQCTLCDHKSFHSFWEFQRHSALHTMTHRISCDICNRSFASKGSLYCHMLLHGEKKHACTKCGKRFALKTALKNHERQHSDERPFKCSICGKGFKTYTIHRAHFLTHIGVKPYKCETCARLFAQKQQLIAHSRTHTGEKPFICPYCGVAFALNGNLTVHKRRHTGEMPYVCDYCQKGFYDTSSRKKHMKKCCAQ